MKRIRHCSVLSQKENFFRRSCLTFIEKIHIIRESVAKYLGVYNDQSFSWKHRINVSSKISRSLGNFYKKEIY